MVESVLLFMPLPVECKLGLHLAKPVPVCFHISLWYCK